MGTSEFNVGGSSSDRVASYSGENRNAPGHFILEKPEISASLMCHLAQMQTLFTPVFSVLHGAVSVGVLLHVLLFDDSPLITSHLSPNTLTL